MMESDGKPSGEVRSPAVAGQFYSDSAEALALGIQQYMEDAVPAAIREPIALILPHAGYVYSGQIAADGYNQVRGREYDAVVLLGTNHATADFRKVGLYPGRGFRTPLGIAEIDQEINAALMRENPDFVADRAVHARSPSCRSFSPRPGSFPC